MFATPHKKSANVVCKEGDVDPNQGLTTSEAHKRLEKYGKNELPCEPPDSWLMLLFKTFDDRLVQILLAAAVLSFGMAIFSGVGHDLVEPFVILLILLANGIIGAWQESSAEEAIQALQVLVPNRSSVLREGQLGTIDSLELVPGDIIELAVGDRIAADLRVLKLCSTTVRVNQSSLTGESNEVLKHSELCEENERFPSNMMFRGTSVTYGKVRGVVTATGINTEIGRVEAQVRSTEAEKTPLQRKLDDFSVLLSHAIGVICVLVFIVNLVRGWQKGENQNVLPWIINSLKIAVSLAVAAIPEGLPAVVTTCLALGARRMARKKAIVRNLPSVETLGCCSVICTDKTGTLTTNMMSVATVVTSDGSDGVNRYFLKDTKFNIETSTVSDENEHEISAPLLTDKALERISYISSLCNDASLEFLTETGAVDRLGEATEAALLVMVEKLGMPIPNASPPCTSSEGVSAVRSFWRNIFSVNATLEFTRERKSMSVHVTSKKKHLLLVKGAPEALLRRSTHIISSSGKLRKLTSAIRRQMEAELHEMTQGPPTLRCLAAAYKECDRVESLSLTNPKNFDSIEAGLVFCGLVGMLDPPRTEVTQAVQECHKAGIRVIVITGDSKDTAQSVCRQIQLFTTSEQAEQMSINGCDFEALSHEEQMSAVLSKQLYSRADPSLKSHLVTLLQSQNFICAMTGDGVNDAPALKKADIGVAMGSGTEVAKGTSAMILADDNFNTIVSAIAEGRAIYNNTKQFIRYLISSNIGEVVCVFATGVLGVPDALEPVQLLWVNLVTDGLPATALGFNPPDGDLMREPPRRTEEPIVNGWLFARYLIIGAYVGFATVMGYLWWFHVHGYGMEELMDPSLCTGDVARCERLRDPREARAVALSILVLVEMFNALNAISENESMLQCPPFRNPWLILAVLSSLVLHYLIMYVPALCYLFNVAPLGVAGVNPRQILEVSSTLLWPTDFLEWKLIFALSFPRHYS